MHIFSSEIASRIKLRVEYARAILRFRIDQDIRKSQTITKITLKGDIQGMGW